MRGLAAWGSSCSRQSGRGNTSSSIHHTQSAPMRQASSMPRQKPPEPPTLSWCMTVRRASEPLGSAVGAAVVDDQYAIYRTVGTEARDVTLQQGEAIVCDYYCYYHCVRFKFEFGVWLLTLTRPEAAEKSPTRDGAAEKYPDAGRVAPIRACVGWQRLVIAFGT